MKFPMPLHVMRVPCDDCGEIISVATDAERATCPSPCAPPVRIHGEPLAATLQREAVSHFPV